MLRFLKMTVLLAMMILYGTIASANIIKYDDNEDYARQLRFDRYLDVEVWTDDEEYYEGDEIRISFRANMDCYVAIYDIDTRGRVNLIFPADPYEENMIAGEEVYTLPGDYDDYELTVSGPEGIEHIRIVASKRPFDLPDWFDGSGITTDYDAYDFIDFIDANYFGGERNMRRAYDMTSFYVEEWHPHYFRPVYVDRHYHHHHNGYWDWGLYGSVYVDYPFGATVYIDGIYWGIAPLFIPRIYYGHHYVTIYDNYGYCWESRVQIHKTKSIVLNETRIKTLPNVKSRFKEVQKKGYLVPEKNGYADYKTKVASKKAHKSISKTAKISKNYVVEKSKSSSKRTNTYKKSQRTASKSTSKYMKKSSSNEKSSGTKYKKNSNSKTSKSTETRKSYRTGKSSKKSSSSKSEKSSTYKKSGKSSSSSKSSGSVWKTVKSALGKGSKSDKKSSGKSSGKSSSSSVGKSSSKSSNSGSSSSKSSSDSGSKSSGGSKREKSGKSGSKRR